MYKSIFAPFSTHGDQAPALAFAAMLAEASDGTAHCTFASKTLDVLEGPEKTRIQETFRSKGYAPAMDLADALYADQFGKRAEKAKAWFEEYRKSSGLKRLKWREPFHIYGHGAVQMQEEVSFHDLTVVSGDLSHTMYDHVIEAALFGTGRPLALIRKPVEAASLSKMTVMLAWKNTPQSLRAQWFALPILSEARKVVVAHVVEEGSDPKEIDRAAEHLKAHGAKVESKVLYGAGPAEAALEKAYEAVGASLLVMGAYSRPRWRETVLGGFTRHFLKSSGCNLFLAH